MIIVQLAGGLGNQLFQYAMGRALAIRNNCELKLDLSFFENYEWHEYGLEPFHIKKNLATKEEINVLKALSQKKYNVIKRKIFLKNLYFVNEKSLLFNNTYLHIKSPAYIVGYWQSEKYFMEYSEILRKELCIDYSPSDPNKEILSRIKTTEAVSLHIRRGNYVNVDFVNKVHGTCSMDYYEAAISDISTKCKKPVFYIFSDDITWAKENLKIPFDNEFIDINDAKTDYEDLRLMYNCKHHILANSTFSWWGAWLNPNSDKIVIAPKQWFVDKVKNAQTIDLIPKEWRRL